MRIRFSKSRMAAFVALLLIAAAALWTFSPDRSIPRDIQRVVLISIDTCRADHLSCYGYPDQTTPHIDALAADGIRFDNVISPVPQTLPAHISMLSGTVPPYHGIHDNHDYGLDPSLVMMPEILQANGFATGAIIGSFVLDARTGLDQGFETYNDDFEDAHKAISIIERKAQETSRLAVDWLEENRQDKFFLFLHYFDPHAPYKPPAPFAAPFADNLYAGEIAYTDSCIGQVIAKLKELELYDSTLIIVTADHGEMRGEHGEPSHAYFIYQSAIKVPLIFKVPGEINPRVVSDLVGLIDIAPTVCSLVGLETPPQVQGADLSAYLANKRPANRHKYLYCETLYPTKYNIDLNPLLGVVTADDFKYIKTTRPELYNLAEDPGELNNLIASQPQRARILDAYLTQMLEDLPGYEETSGSPLDPETVQRLQSLGYVGGGVKGFDFDPNRKDPKDFVELHHKYALIPSLINEGDRATATQYCRQILQEHPQFYMSHFFLARIAKIENNLEEAASHWNIVLGHEPDNYDVLCGLADALVGLGELEKAIKHYEQALELNPSNTVLYNNLGATLAQIGRYEEAAAYFQKSFNAAPESRETQVNLLRALVTINRVDEATQCVEQIVTLAPDQSAVVYNEFAALLGQMNKFDLAITNFQKALQISPNDVTARHHLAQTLASQGRFDEAIGHYQKLLQVDPAQFVFQKQLGMLYLRQKQYDKAHTHLAESLGLKAGQADVLHNLARTRKAQGQTAQAVDYWEQALELRADWPAVLNNVAWIRATSPDPQLYQPEEAIRLARRACEVAGYEKASLLDTLAAALAAVGNFSDAITTAEKALDVVRAEGMEKVAAQIEERLELYKTNQPYRELRP